MSKQNFISSEELLLDERFLCWVQGKAKESDNQWVQSLISQSPEQEDEVADAVTLYQALHLKSAPVPDAELQARRLLDQLERLDDHKRSTITLLQRSRTGVFAALVLTAFVLAGTLFYRLGVQDNSMVIPALSESTRRLKDGTEVRLAENSTITLSPSFDKASRREVWVKGEAEFKVQKKKDKKPFIVHMDPFDVEVTGTVFQTINLPQKSSVLLREGSVRLLFKDGTVLEMTPGDFYEYSRPSVPHVNESGKALEVPVLEKKIMFEDMTIEQVAAQIESRYAVTISIQSPALAARRITGILPNDNLEVLINALQIATESTAQLKGSTIVFTPN